MTQILILIVWMFSWNQILGVKVRLLFYWTCLCLPSWPSMLWDNMIAVCERLPLWLVLLHLLLRLSNWRKLVCYQRAASQNWRSADTIVNTCSLHFSDCFPTWRRFGRMSRHISKCGQHTAVSVIIYYSIAPASSWNFPRVHQRHFILLLPAHLSFITCRYF